jgi:hypothetical protein
VVQGQRGEPARRGTASTLKALAGRTEGLDSRAQSSPVQWREDPSAARNPPIGLARRRARTEPTAQRGIRLCDQPDGGPEHVWRAAFVLPGRCGPRDGVRHELAVAGFRIRANNNNSKGTEEQSQTEEPG